MTKHLNQILHEVYLPCSAFCAHSYGDAKARLELKIFPDLFHVFRTFSALRKSSSHFTATGIRFISLHLDSTRFIRKRRLTFRVG